MKQFLIFFSLILAGCGTRFLRDDSSLTNDANAKFESVLTSVNGEYGFGSKVYVLRDLTGSLRIHALLTGSYELRADSCGVIEDGRFDSSTPIEIPVNRFFNAVEDKLCTVTIQVNPEVPDSEFAVYPRYSIIYLQMSARASLPSLSHQIPKGFPLEPLRYRAVDRFRAIRKCSYEPQPIVVKENRSPGTLMLSRADFSNGLPFAVEDRIGTCLFSIVFVESGVTGRLMLSTSVYDPAHQPLTASATIQGSRLRVSGSDDVSVCAINGKIKNSSNCNEKLSRLGSLNVIEVHSNKRSGYLLWSPPL